MKNNLHTELRESWKKAMGKPPNWSYIDKLTGGMRCCELCGVSADKIADWWLQKFEVLTKQVSIQDDIQVENPECIHCGLLKSTIDAVGETNLENPIARCKHDFGIVNPMSTLESLIEECGDEFASLRQPGGHGGFGLITGREAEYEKWLKEHSGKWEAHGTQKHFHGKTPKEAVERLLEELRKNI